MARGAWIQDVTQFPEIPGNCIHLLFEVYVLLNFCDLQSSSVYIPGKPFWKVASRLQATPTESKPAFIKFSNLHIQAWEVLLSATEPLHIELPINELRLSMGNISHPHLLSSASSFIIRARNTFTVMFLCDLSGSVAIYLNALSLVGMILLC